MSRRRLVRFAATAGAAVAVAACVPVTQQPPPQQQPSPGPAPLVNKTTLVNGLDKPWDIAFIPGATSIGGSMLYTENDRGTVSLYVSSSGPRRVLTTLPGLDSSGEGGAMGIAIDPDYATNRFVYVCYSTSSDNRVARFVATLDGAGRPQSLALDTDIITGMDHAGVHNGCRIRFDPSTGATNPALFVTMGDAAIGTNPQSTTSPNGKVLRVDRDGNPYVGNLSGQLWYTRGHRNPQGIAFRPEDGVPYSAEHGPDKDDEINRLSPDRNGGSSGWNPVPGYNQTVPMTDVSLGSDVFGPVWTSGPSTIALSGIDFLRNGTAAGWGGWTGDIVGAVLKNHELRRFDVDASGAIVGTQEIFDDGGTRLRVPVIGPDGALYVATDVPAPNGQIWRVTRA